MKSKNTIVALGLGLAGLYLYMAHRATGLQIGDSAEYVVAAATGTLVHPPGYPLYTLVLSWIGKVSSSQALYANVSAFSALCAAISISLLFLMTIRLSKNIYVATALTLTWMLHPAMLRSALDAEVFALHHMLCIALVSFGLSRLNKYSGPCSFFFFGLLCGLGAAHHHMIVLWAPFVLSVFWLTSQQRSIRSWIGFSAGTAMGLLAYSLLWLHQQSNPDFAFLPITGWGDLFSYALRGPYGTLELAAQAPTDSTSYLPIWLRHLGLTSLLPSLFIFVGLSKIRSESLLRDKMLIGLYLSLVLHIVFVGLIQLPAAPHYQALAERFFGAPLLVALLLAAKSSPDFSTKALKLLCLGQCLLVLLTSPGALAENSPKDDHRGELFLQEAFAELPDKAIWLTQSDTSIFGARYGQEVLNLGSKNIILIAAPRLASPKYRSQLQKRVEFLRDKSSEQFKQVADLSTLARDAGYRVFSDPVPPPSGFKRWPHGFLFEWLPQDVEFSLSELEKNLLQLCTRWPQGKSHQKNRKDVWIWPEPFLSPLTQTLQHAASAYKIDSLKIALMHLEQAQIVKAQNYCGEELKKLAVQDAAAIPEPDTADESAAP